MNRGVERIPIETVVVGKRRRQEMGDIAGLAESIRVWGLIHPLTVDAENQLIAGGRRLAALQRLGYQEVEVRRWERLSDNERRELELEENLQRKDLTAYERSKTLADLAETVRRVDLETGEILDGADEGFRVDSPRNPKGGRPPERGSLRRVSERINTPTKTIRDAQKHVAAAETHPFLQQPGWKQYHALEAADILNAMPPDQQAAAAALIDQPGIPPQDALPILKNLAAKPEPERRHIFDLAASDDQRDRQLALTKAAALPPMPDPRLTNLRRALHEQQAALHAFGDDPACPAIRAAIAACEAAISFIKEHPRHDDRQREVS